MLSSPYGLVFVSSKLLDVGLVCEEPAAGSCAEDEKDEKFGLGVGAEGVGVNEKAEGDGCTMVDWYVNGVLAGRELG